VLLALAGIVFVAAITTLWNDQ